MISNRAISEDHETLTPAGLLAFNILQLIGVVGFVIILSTALLSKHIKRNSTWISFCVGWTIAGVAYLLLLFVDGQNGKEPQFGVCVVQAALVHSVPVLQASTNLSLLIQTWMFVRSTLSQKTAPLPTTVSKFLLLGFPYLLSLSMFLGFLFFGINNPSTVKRRAERVYCDIYLDEIPNIVTSGVTGLLLVVALLFKGLLGLQLYQHWNVLSKDSACVSMVLRVKVFTLMVAIIFVLTLVYCFTSVNGLPGPVFLAIIPVMALLALGTRYVKGLAYPANKTPYNP
ncbi:hypothetical protein ONZ45_g3300 [Pleurotus djamor]|nr:hypothetical protein ONZ45_g3300 [Pleurotus djamor]